MNAISTRRLADIGGRVGLCIALVCSLMLVMPAPASAADVIHVNVSSGSDATGNGTPAKPYRSVRKGLSVAASGDCVRIAAGEYSVAASGEVFPLAVPRGVRVQGTGTAYATIVRGNGAASVFRITNGDENTIVEGLTITNGGGVSGAGIYVYGGSNPGGGPTIRRNIVGGNAATGTGGGIAIVKDPARPCAPVLEHNMFISNSAVNGGAIYVQQASFDSLGDYFIANDASGVGGAMCLLACPSSSVSQAMIGGNEAAAAGAYYTLSGGTHEIWDSMFTANKATGSGGALYNNGTTYVLTQNCLLFGNQAVDGGAAINFSGSMAFNLCTLYENDATGLGDGIRATGGTVGVSSSIMWANNGDDIEGAASVTYSDIQEAAIAGAGVIHSDPRFLNPAQMDFRLQSSSPCVDTGSPAVSGGHDYDQISRPKDGDGNGSSRADMGALEYWLDVQRDAGATRYSTATELWGDRMPMGHHVVIATGLNFPDALCASSLAGIYEAPILLTKPTALSSEVVAALEEHNTYEAFIVGGPDVVSDSVVTQLEGMDIDVTRLYGADRYATARAVADHIAGITSPTRCLVARGDLFPDALAFAPIAGSQAAPVLLVKPTSMPAATKAAFEEHGYTAAVIGGDTTAVSADVQNLVEAYVGSANVDRLGGETRYETAAEIATYAIAHNWLGPDFIGLATGDNFPDALAGGAACAFEYGPLLLTKQDSLRSAPRTVMLANQDELREIYLFGGSDVLSDDIMDACAQLMP